MDQEHSAAPPSSSSATPAALGGKASPSAGQPGHRNPSGGGRAPFRKWLRRAGWALGLLGILVCMVGVMLPSSLLTWQATRWGHRNRNRRSVRAFKQGMAPVVIGLLLATAWVLTRAHGPELANWPLWAITAATTLLVWRTKLHLLWMLGAGAVAGGMGWI